MCIAEQSITASFGGMPDVVSTAVDALTSIQRTEEASSRRYFMCDAHVYAFHVTFTY